MRSTQHDRTWRLGALLREVWLNLRNDQARLSVLFVVTTGLLAAVALAEGSATNRYHQRDRAEREAGRDILVISPSGPSQGVDAAACERLANQPTVIASGSDFGTRLRELGRRPGNRVAVTEGTYGLLRVLGYEEPARLAAASRLRAALSGRELRARFGMVPGSAVTVLVDRSMGARDEVELSVAASVANLPRDPDAGRSLFVVVSSVGLADQCIVQVQPEAMPYLVNGGLLALARFGDAPLAVRPFLSSRLDPGGPGAPLPSPGVFAAALGVVLVWELVRLSRRHDAALYRSLGTSRWQLAVMASAEYLIVLALAVATSITICTLHVAQVRWFREALDDAVRTAVFTGLVALGVRVPLTLIGYAGDILRDLKDR